MTREIGMIQTYSGVCLATSETNTLGIVTSWSNDIMLAKPSMFCASNPWVRTLGLPLNFIHPDHEALSEDRILMIHTVLENRGKRRWSYRRCTIPCSLATDPQKLTVTTRLFLELEWRSHNRPMAKGRHNAIHHWVNCEFHLRILLGNWDNPNSVWETPKIYEMRLRLSDLELGKITKYVKCFPRRHVGGSKRFHEAGAHLWY